MIIIYVCFHSASPPSQRGPRPQRPAAPRQTCRPLRPSLLRPVTLGHRDPRLLGRPATRSDRALPARDADPACRGELRLGADRSAQLPK